MDESRDLVDVPNRNEVTSSLFLAQAEDLTHLGCFEWDLNFNTLRWSDGMYRVFGYQPQEFEATLEGFMDRVLPEDREKVQVAIRNAITNRSAFECLERIHHASGAIRQLESRGQVILDEQGEPIKLMGVCRDVTARVDSERRQAWQIDGLKLLADSTSTILVESATQQWTPMFGDICGHLGCDGFANFVFDGNALQLAAIEGFPRHMVKVLDRMELDEGMCGVCAASREVLYVPFEKLSDYPQSRGLRDIGVRMFVGVPLLVDNRLLGTLSFVSRQRSSLNESERDFVQTVGQLVSAAISQKFYEIQVAENEQHFRAIVDSTADAILLFELEGSILDVNRETCVSLGYTRDELLGMVVGDIMEALPEEFSNGCQSMMDKPCLLYGRHLRKDGSLIDVEVRANIIDFRSKKAVLASVRDTTERLRAQRQKRQAEETSRLVLEHAKMVTWEADPSTLDFQFLSGACVDLLGFTHDEWTQPGFWRRAIHPDDLVGVLEKIKLASWDGQRFEYRMRRDAGEYIWVEAIVKAVVESGVLTSLRGFFSNIHHRKTLEVKLQHSQKMEAIGRLAGGVAHDFNNLLTVISTYAELIALPEQGEDEFREAVESIQDAVQRATSLTDQLLMFGRASRNRQRVLDINAAIENSQRLLRRLIGEDIRLSTKFQPNLPCVLADPSHLDQVIVNLAVNARDAMPSGGCLDFETSLTHVQDSDTEYDDLAAGEYVELVVTDTGCGMTEDVRARAFEPFFTTKPVGEGSGLGLSVVYGVIQESGGSVVVGSQLGEGTEFRILLPVTNSDAIVSQPDVASPPNRGTERILFVEDDHAVRRATSAALKVHGYDVIEADSGVEARRIVKETGGDFAMLITDLVMPHVGGIELADEIREQFPSVKILCVSGYSESSAGRGQTYPFLPKPFTINGLLAKAREVLDT